MKNKFFSVFLIICYIINMLVVPSAAAVSPNVSVGEGTGEIGKLVEIPVVLSGNVGFVSLGVEISYDKTVLELTKVTNNSDIGATFTKAQTLDVMPYNLGWSSAENISFNGTLAVLTFKVLTDKSGDYPIDISYYKGRNGNYTDGYDVNYDENFEDMNLSYTKGKIVVKGTELPIEPPTEPDTGEDGVVVYVGNVKGNYNESVEVPVVIEGNCGFVSLGIEISYDKTILELTKVTNNSDVGATFTKAQTLDAMPYNLGWSSAENISFNGTLAVLTFKVLTDKSGEYPIGISYYKGRNGNYTDGYDVNYDENFEALRLNYVSGKITVGGNNAINVTVNGRKVVFENAEELNGFVIVAVYKNTGELRIARKYSARAEITDTFDEIETGDCVKVMWWNGINSLKPVKAYKIIQF